MSPSLFKGISSAITPDVEGNLGAHGALQHTIRYPSRASAKAAAMPIPDPAPVTSATGFMYRLLLSLRLDVTDSGDAPLALRTRGTKACAQGLANIIIYEETCI